MKNGKIFWNRFTGPIKSECFAAVRITCSKCQECSAKTVASVGINCWRKSAFLFGNIGLCVPEPIYEYVRCNIQSRFFRAVCLDLGSRLFASIKRIIEEQARSELQYYPTYSQFHSTGKSNFYSSERRYLERRWKTTTSVLRVMTSKNGA